MAPFPVAEFNFMTTNGTVHHHIPPYHPSSNVLAENMMKSIMNKSKIVKDYTIETHIAHFLASYHNTHHSTTSRTPQEILLKVD